MRVTSSDGVDLAVQVRGSGTATVLAVHGYPDNHGVWDGLAAVMAGEYRVVTYDVRGTGASGQPGTRTGYRVAQLIDDLVAVVDAVDDGGPIHLVGHDWGSTQCWAALPDPRLRDRVVSYLSVSGPALDHAAAWLRDVRKHPAASARQFLHSYYIALFLLPRVPELAIRRGVFDRSIPPAAYRQQRDKLNGLELYRANVPRAMARTTPRPIDVPVLVVAPEKDAYLTERVCFEAPAPHVRDLRTRTVPGGHWVVEQHPERIAALLREFVGTVGGR